MSIVIEWRHYVAGTVYDISDRINLTDAAFSVTENAEELTVGASTLVIDDPEGDFDIPGHSYVRVTETDAEDDKVIWAGFVTIRHIKRDVGFMTGAARTWTGNLDDVNTIMARHILGEENDADRPLETDVERIQWLFDQGFLGVLDTWFSTANPVAMDAANCIGTTVYDVVNDCMLQSGKNAYQQDISDGLGGFINFTYYDFASSEVLSSELQISNYISDITAEVGRPSPSGAAQTWYASFDTDMQRDPTRVYWKVVGQYDGGTVTRKRPATSDMFAARDTTASWPLVKTAAKANARGDRYLLDISTEEDIITTTIWVHPEHVNDARAGRRIQARFSHLPGYEDWTWMRILNRTVTLETPEVYRIQYTLSPGSAAIPAGSCATALATAQAWDSGAQIHVNETAPFTFTPSITASAPSVVIGFWAAINQTEPIAGNGTPPYVFNDYTGLGVSRPTPGSGPYASLAVAGYEAIASGAAGAMEFTDDMGTGSAARSWRALAMAFETASTSPVQSGVQYNTGHTVTLGAPPTEGNVLVLCWFGENGSWSPPSPPTGWTVAASGTFYDTTGVSYLAIATRCALAGESASVEVGNSSFSHWAFLSEWAVT